MTEVEIRRAPKGQNPNLATHQLISIEIDPTVTNEQIQEGLAREITRKIQAARKSADFNLDDRIKLELHCTGALKDAATTHQKMICEETLADQFAFADAPQGKHTEVVDIDGEIVKIGITPLPKRT